MKHALALCIYVISFFHWCRMGWPPNVMTGAMCYNGMGGIHIASVYMYATYSTQTELLLYLPLLSWVGAGSYLQHPF